MSQIRLLLPAALMVAGLSGCGPSASETCDELAAHLESKSSDRNLALPPDLYERALYDDDVEEMCPYETELFFSGGFERKNKPGSQGGNDGSMSDTECAAHRMLALDNSRSEWDRAGSAVDYGQHCE